MDVCRKLFGNDFMPHGHCYYWRADVLWMNVAGDLLTAIAYFIIPLGLYYYASKRKDLSFRPIFTLFSLFILSCGTTHILDIISVWNPIYYIEGAAKIFTGVVSLITAYVLIKIIPDALMIPSISETKKLYEELNQQNRALQRVAYATSHNMREPIRGLTIYAQRIKAKHKEALPKDVQEDLDYMIAEGNRMYDIIDSLMDYANINSENFPLEKVSLKNVLNHVATSLRVSFNETNTKLTFDNLPEIKGNENLLFMLFQKLINNSIRFRGENNPVINITSSVNDTSCVITYTDNSIGFDMQHHDRVFEMFEGLHTEVSKRSSGMGLAITKRIIDLHHGEITVFSEEGNGVKFTIVLPMYS